MLYLTVYVVSIIPFLDNYDDPVQAPCSFVACFRFPNGRMDVLTPCTKIMTTYSAGAWWINNDICLLYDSSSIEGTDSNYCCSCTLYSITYEGMDKYG